MEGAGVDGPKKINLIFPPSVFCQQEISDDLKVPKLSSRRRRRRRRGRRGRRRRRQEEGER